jgi:hypothetical protein
MIRPIRSETEYDEALEGMVQVQKIKDFAPATKQI